MGQVTQVMNQEFLQAVADFVASQNSTEATQRATIILILLKKIREVMDEIIQSYPPAIHEQANRFWPRCSQPRCPMRSLVFNPVWAARSKAVGAVGLASGQSKVSHHRNHRLASGFLLLDGIMTCCFSALPVVRPHSSRGSSLGSFR